MLADILRTHSQSRKHSVGPMLSDRVATCADIGQGDVVRIEQE